MRRLETRFAIELQTDDNVLTVGNGYKNIRVNFDIPPGVIQVTILRDGKQGSGGSDATLTLDDEAQECIASSISDECSNPEKCAVWMLDEIFAA